MMKIPKKTGKNDKLVEELKTKINQLENNWKRALADYQNLEKQVQAQKRDWLDFATRELVLKLLPILSNLEKSAAHLKDKGLELTVGQFKKLLEQEGLEEIVVEPGKTNFDAAWMECIDVARGKENQVIKVLEKGYKLKGRLLRTAQVVVGKEKPDERQEKLAKDQLQKGNYM
jgi:molecular chaperone GrpE